MKKILASGAAAFLVLAGLTFGGATAANAAEGQCVPSDAWTEVVVDTPEVPAVPAVPEVAEVSHTVHHEAETSVVHHEAVVHTEYHFAKFTRERTREKNRGQWSDWSDYDPWTKWSPETHTSWQLSTTPLGQPEFHSSGTRDNNKTQWERQWQALYDGQTRKVEDKAAWDETVVTKAAWDEKVIDVAYVPGTPEIPAVPAVTHTVEHEAVTCAPNPANPKAKIQASCGLADLHLKNPTDEGTNLTASFIVNVDGQFYGAYSVASEEVKDFQITFGEDTGTHKIEVYQAGTSEYKLIADASVESDCQPPVIVVPEQPKPIVTVSEHDSKVCEDKTITTTVTTTTSNRTVYNAETNTWDPIEDLVEVTSSQRPTTAEDCPTSVIPPKESKPTPSKSAVAVVAKVNNDDLAETGGGIPWGLIIGGSLLAGLGVAFRFIPKRAK